MLWNAANLGMTLRYRAAETAAKALNVSVQTLGVREPNDFDAAFAEMTRSRPDGILMVSDALTTLNRKRVIEFATANRLPAIYELSPPGARRRSDVIRAGSARDRRPRSRFRSSDIARS
jgi:putative ABC transport system substrate-binding protein